jgi:acylphosphatase
MNNNAVNRAVVWSGRVQGVGFRIAASNVASRFAVCGVIRNEPDGTVRCELTGAALELDRFIEAVEARMDQYVHDRHESAPGILAMPEQGFDIV